MVEVDILSKRIWSATVAQVLYPQGVEKALKECDWPNDQGTNLKRIEMVDVNCAIYELVILLLFVYSVHPSQVLQVAVPSFLLLGLFSKSSKPSGLFTSGMPPSTLDIGKSPRRMKNHKFWKSMQRGSKYSKLNSPI